MVSADTRPRTSAPVNSNITARKTACLRLPTANRVMQRHAIHTDCILAGNLEAFFEILMAVAVPIFVSRSCHDSRDSRRSHSRLKQKASKAKQRLKELQVATPVYSHHDQLSAGKTIWTRDKKTTRRPATVRLRREASCHGFACCGRRKPGS
jgi:hypothetical protein